MASELKKVVFVNGSGLTDEESLSIFCPIASESHASAKESNQLFAHYTSARVAQSILQKSEFWMRNALHQNDFSEIQYAQSMLRETFQSELGGSFFKSLDRCHEGLGDEVRSVYESQDFQRRLLQETFIACITKHYQQEAGVGRLSMWRAYGGTNPVAIVFAQKALVRPEANPGGFVQPVHYANQEHFRQELVRTTGRIFDARDRLSLVPRQDVKNLAVGSLLAKVTCTKHPGFREECEWRLVMSSLYGCQLAGPQYSLEEIEGAQQVVYKARLALPGADDVAGMTMESAIHQIIIGPCADPQSVRKSLVDQLQGVISLSDRVVFSDIPLRRKQLRVK